MKLKLLIIFLGVSLLLLYVNLPALSDTKSRPLFVDAVDYRTIENVEGCEVEPYHKPRQYPQCTDPEKLFEAAKAFALEHNLPLLIDWDLMNAQLVSHV